MEKTKVKPPIPRGSSWSLGVLIAAFVAIVLFDDPSTARGLEPNVACHTGAYRLSDGKFLIVTGWNGAPGDVVSVLSTGEIAHLKRKAAGRYEGTAQPFPELVVDDCARGSLRFFPGKGLSVNGLRIPMRSEQTTFSTSGGTLYGRLVSPAHKKVKTAVVWVQGSESSPATEDSYWQYVLPQDGVAVFTYDKRGTGSSSGQPTSNFDLRADDTIAAIAELRRLLPAVHRIGVFGVSQGGWVAPLVARRVDVAFVIVAYGLAEGLTAQDRDVVATDLKTAGYHDAELAKARLLSDAAAKIVLSHAQSGWKEFGLLKRRFARESWLKAIGPNTYTGTLLSKPLGQIEQEWRESPDDTLFSYDPRPTITHLMIPQLWVLAAKDHTAPSARTVTILGDLQKSNPNIDIAIIKNADHGMVEVRSSQDSATRIASSYFAIVRSWIRIGRFPRTGSEVVLRSGRSATKSTIAGTGERQGKIEDLRKR